MRRLGLEIDGDVGEEEMEAEEEYGQEEEEDLGVVEDVDEDGVDEELLVHGRAAGVESNQESEGEGATSSVHVR